MDRQKRRSTLKTRLALIALGLALGFTARWVSGWIAAGQQPRHFDPMPVTLDDSAPATDPAEEQQNSPDETVNADLDAEARANTSQ